MSRAVGTTPLEFHLNGRAVQVEPRAMECTLLDFIRASGLTGAKEGCAEGECGACAVALVSPHGSGSAYRIVNSCLMPVALAAHQEVHTVESLAEGGVLSPAQQAMAAAGGSQCGYCTPGFVMSLFAEHYRPGRDTPCDPHAMAGNLCRCTGYRPIRDAALSLGPPPPGAFLDRLAQAAPTLGRISTPGFSRPSTIDECISLLTNDPDATLIAGGTDLGVEWNLRGRRFAHLVSLEAIDELRDCVLTPASLRIGAAVSLGDLAAHWPDAPTAVHEWLELFASPSIRNRATLGGNLVTASPIGDSAPLLLALDAVVHIAGSGGRRSVPLSEFFLAYRRTALAPREIVTAVEIPLPPPDLLRFYKVTKRRFDDISTVAVAIAMDIRAGVVRRARFAFGGVAATPLRVAEAETLALNRRWDLAAVRDVQNVLARTLTPMTDHRGSKEYRLAIAQSLIEKFWWEQRA